MRRGKFVWKDKAKTGVVFMEDPKGKYFIEGPKEDVFGNKTKKKPVKKHRSYPKKSHPCVFVGSAGLLRSISIFTLVDIVPSRLASIFVPPLTLIHAFLKCLSTPVVMWIRTIIATSFSFAHSFNNNEFFIADCISS